MFVLSDAPHRLQLISIWGILALAIGLTPAPVFAQVTGSSANAIESPNATGASRTITTLTSFDMNNPFFHSLGTNGRSCATCHGLSEGLNFTAERAQKIFDETAGLDPIFARVDGVDSPNGDMSTVDARRANTSLIRNRGLIRVELNLPSNAEFTIERVEDPYHYANQTRISAYRRPLPSTNLRFVSTVMWDGRELTSHESVRKALRAQIVDAVLGHMQAPTPPSRAVVNQIVDFETHLFTTQVYDNEAGRLDESPIFAGPESLLGGRTRALERRVSGPHPHRERRENPTGRLPRPFDVFRYFQPWFDVSRNSPTPEHLRQDAIARGEKLFNTRPFLISNVPGFSDRNSREARSRGRSLKGGARVGTCSSCHNLPALGSSSGPLLMNTGIADATMRTPDMPLYTLKNKKTGARIQTTDPGAAMTTGKWSDIGKFKVPSLRALETHSPYMHNGFSAELFDVIQFYDNRFTIGLSDSEKDDLKAFLEAL